MVGSMINYVISSIPIIHTCWSYNKFMSDSFSLGNKIIKVDLRRV